MVPHWKKTSVARFKILKQSGGVADNILKKYPILCDPKYGYQLIDIDFRELFNSNSDDIYENWDPLFQKLWDVTSQKRISKSLQIYKDALSNENINPSKYCYRYIK